MVIEALIAKALLAAMRKTPDCRSPVPVQALVPDSVRTPVPTLRMTLPVTPPAAKAPEKVVEMLLPPTIKVLVVLPELVIVPAPEREPIVLF